MSDTEWITHMVFEGRLNDLSEALLQNRDLVHMPNRWGDQPLHSACLAKQLQLVPLLITFGANVNARGYCGRTPLHYAVHEGTPLSAAIVWALLHAGADPSARDSGGYTPAEWAKVEMSEGLTEVLKLLGDAYASRAGESADDESAGSPNRYGLAAVGRTAGFDVDIDEALDDPGDVQMSISTRDWSLRFALAARDDVAEMLSFLRNAAGQRGPSELALGFFHGAPVLLVKDDEFADRFWIRITVAGHLAEFVLAGNDADELAKALAQAVEDLRN